MRELSSGLALLFRVSTLTTSATFGAILLGIWLDRFLGTAPFGTLCCVVIGITIGTIGVYRMVNQANQRVSGGKKQ